MTSGWDQSAGAWIANLGEHGDFGRRFVLDHVMRGRVADRGFATALDVGCGEGRFCRMMRNCGIRTVGIDPTAALLHKAKELDPSGDYRSARAEKLEFDTGHFHLVVSYLSLINIPDIERAIAEMARVLKPGGTLLIASLTSFTSCAPTGWVNDADGKPLYYAIDNYLEERPIWVNWRGIRVQNWHRPLSAYMTLLLSNNLQLKFFAEPSPIGGEPAKAERNQRVPYHVVMEWMKALT
jgi:2-polyprenyl-3-methyl-5-hydroxy-6-metoxy-1,4-benzoquinol methylase